MNVPSLSIEDATDFAKQMALQMGVDPKIAGYIVGNGENQGRRSVSTDTTSPAGAQGIMQVMPETLASLQSKGYVPTNYDPNNPQHQIQAGVAAIKEINDRGITNPREVYAAYNGGTAQLNNLRNGQPLAPETYNYLKRAGVSMDGVSQGTQSTTNSSHESVKSNVLPPDIDASIKSAAANASSGAAGLQANLSSLADSITNATNARTTATIQAGQAQASATEAGGALDAAKNTNVNQILQDFGITNNDGTLSASMVKAQAVAADASSRRIDLAQQIEQLKGTDVTKDPLGWFVNNLKAMPLISQHNAAADTENAANQAISEAHAKATNQEAIQPGVLQDQIRAKAHFEAASQLAAAQAQAQGMALDASSRLAQNAIAQQSINQQQFGNTIQLGRMFMDKTAMSYGMSERETSKIMDTPGLPLVNTYLAAIDPGFTGLKADEFKQLPKPLQAQLTQLGTGEGTSNVGENISAIAQKIGPAGLVRAYQKNPMVGDFLKQAITQGNNYVEDAYNKSTTAVAGAMPVPLPPELSQFKRNGYEQTAWGINQWIHNSVAETAGGDYTEKVPGKIGGLSPNNIYLMKPQIAANLLPLKDNEFSSYIKTQASSPANPSGKVPSVTDLLQHAAGRVVAGEPAPAVAQELENFMITGYKSQLADSLQIGMGVPYKPTYPIRIGNMATQMLNKTSIENSLVRMAASAKLSSALDVNSYGMSGLNLVP